MQVANNGAPYLNKIPTTATAINCMWHGHNRIQTAVLKVAKTLCDLLLGV